MSLVRGHLSIFIQSSGVSLRIVMTLPIDTMLKYLDWLDADVKMASAFGSVIRIIWGWAPLYIYIWSGGGGLKEI